MTHKPDYPTGTVNGPCICGSWPGGECLQCPPVPKYMELVRTLPYYKEYYSHMHGAKHRNIEWLFTYESWMKVWLDSGMLEQRGRGKGKACMARKGPDIGPYSPENVVIQLNAQNIKDGRLGKKHSGETRAKMSESRAGRIIGDETRRKLSQFFKGYFVGEKHPHAKLTDNDVIQIRSLADSGVRQHILRKQYNVSKATISDIVNRKRWSHLG